MPTLRVEGMFPSQFSYWKHTLTLQNAREDWFIHKFFQQVMSRNLNRILLKLVTM